MLKMMRSVYPCLPGIVFLLVVAVVFNVVILVLKKTTWVGFNELSCSIYENSPPPANIVDIAVFGASAAFNSITTMTLFDEYGLNAKIFAMGGQDMFANYLIIDELIQLNSTRMILIELHLAYYPNREFPGTGFTFLRDWLPLSFNKITATRRLYNTGHRELAFDYINSITAPLASYHTAWKRFRMQSLNPIIQAEHPYFYYGTIMENRLIDPKTEALPFYGWTDTGDEIDPMKQKIHEEYLIKIIQLCKERNIPLILYKAPALGGFWTPARHNAAQKMANRMGVPFIDFNMQGVLAGIAYNFVADQRDMLHTNRFGAEKVSRYLGKYIRDNFDLPDHRNDPKYAYMYDDLARYKREMFLQNFPIENTMPRWLELVGSTDINNYTVIFSVRDDALAKMGKEIIGKLRGLGFKGGGFFKEPGQGFIGIWQNGKAIYEAQSKTEPLERRGVLPDGMKYYVKSAGTGSGNVSSIVINGVQYSKNRRGFNVVIYDNATGRVIDSINWDTHVDAGLTFKR